LFCLVAATANAGPFVVGQKWYDMALASSVFWAYGTTARDLDWEGAWQLSASIAATQVAVEGLKAVVHEERPDGADHKSFPSGHAAGAFSAAMFVHKRYGWKPAVVPYLLSGMVAVQRVESRRHYWWDIAGSAAVSALFTWAIVDELQVSAGPGHVAVAYKTEF